MARTSSSSFVDVDVTIDPKALARANKRLDKWKGAPLKVRTQKVEQAAGKLYIPALRAQAARHHRTGATERGYAVRKTPLRRREIAAYRVISNTWYKHFAIVGTSRGVEPDRYVEYVGQRLHTPVVKFIKTNIKRLA